jgi:hypothetical protein
LSSCCWLKIFVSRSFPKVPDPLAYFGYVYCFTSFLVGPAFEYADYSRVMDGSAYAKPKQEESPNGGSTNGHGKEQASGQPSSVLPALFKLLQVSAPSPRGGCFGWG